MEPRTDGQTNFMSVATSGYSEKPDNQNLKKISKNLANSKASWLDYLLWGENSHAIKII